MFENLNCPYVTLHKTLIFIMKGIKVERKKEDQETGLC